MISEAEFLAGLTFLHAHAPTAAYRDVAALAVSKAAAVRRHTQLCEIRATRIDQLEISIRLHQALTAMNAVTAGQLEEILSDHDPVDLLASAEAKKARFGKKCLREAREILHNIGLRSGE